jgi:hypothetical protein
MSEGTSTPEPDAARRPPRWWQRALPVAALALLALGAAVLVLPDDEVSLSTSRTPQEFLELAATRTGAQVCSGDTARVAFRVTSHLGGERRVQWRISVDPAGSRPDTVRERGAFWMPPGDARHVLAEVAAPDGPFVLTVRVTDRPELLRLHCTEASS